MLSEKHFRRVLVLVLGVSGVFVVATVAAYCWFFWGPPSDDAAAWAQFGDYVGGLLNPTFSLLALIALLVTLQLQVESLRVSRKELELSRQELEATRRELRRAADAQEASEEIQRRQNHVAMLATRIAARRGWIEAWGANFQAGWAERPGQRDRAALLEYQAALADDLNTLEAIEGLERERQAS